MKKITFIFLIVMVVIGLLPAVSYAQKYNQYGDAILDYSGLVNCDGVVTPGEQYRKERCDFAHLISLVQKIINWLFAITIPIAVVLFAWAGLLHLTGKEANIKKSWAIFQTVAVGLIIMLTGWFMVTTVIKWFAADGSGATSLIEKQN